jgi:2-methylcitrate dehydratase PrpD
VELLIGSQAHDVVGRDIPQRRAPASRIAAQFSVYWTVACALEFGEVTPFQLATEIPPSARMRTAIGRISVRGEAVAAQRDVGGCTLRASGPFGIRDVRHDNAKGHPDYPLSDEELMAKFTANLRYARVGDREAEALAEAILDIDAVEDVTPLFDTLGAER